MRKTISLIMCFALLSICVPFTYAGPQNSYFNTINVPAEIISSFFFYLSPINTAGLRAFIEKIDEKSTNNVRATGEIPIHRIGAGD